MLHKKILIFLLLSQASCTLFYASEKQNNIKSQDKKSSEEQSRTIISWNGINYFLFNNLYYFSTRKYTFGDARFTYYNVYIKYRHTSPPPLILEKEKRFFPRIQEFLYNLFSFSLYFFKKSFFYKIDILGNDIFFYPMTADYTTNIIAFILGTTACKISLINNIKLECRLGIGLTWRRLSYSYTVSYKCKNCNPDKTAVHYPTDVDVDNKLLYDIRMTYKSNGVVLAKGVMYIESTCVHALNFSILKHLKERYTWKHFDIVINCSLLLRSKVTICLNLNLGIREAWQVYKYNTLIRRYNNRNIRIFTIPFILRHFSLSVSYFS